MSELLNVEELFGENVFNLGTMRERLPKNVFKEVKKVMDQGGELSLATADIVAKAMKDWAVEHGATHYTHWFQPLTGITAEKHDSFVQLIPCKKDYLLGSGFQFRFECVVCDILVISLFETPP